MNITIYATAQAGALCPGSVILDLPDLDGTEAYASASALPTAFIVDEVADRADGRTIYAYPAHRTDGPRRVWRVNRTDPMTIELSGMTAANVLEALDLDYHATGLDLVIVDSGGIDAASIVVDVKVNDDA